MRSRTPSPVHTEPAWRGAEATVVPCHVPCLNSPRQQIHVHSRRTAQQQEESYVETSQSVQKCGKYFNLVYKYTGELGYDGLNGTRKISPSYAKSVIYI